MSCIKNSQKKTFFLDREGCMAMGINVGDILGIVSNHIDTHNHTYIPHLTPDFFTSLDNKELCLFLKNRHY
jgi:hypothetical protein